LPVLGAAVDQPPPTNPAPAAKSGVKPSDLFGDSVVAKGKGIEVKRSQLDDEVIRRKGAAAAYGQTIPPEQMALLERQVLDQLIGFQLLLAKATEEEKNKGKEQFEKSLKTYQTEKKITDEEFNEKLGPQLRMQ